MRLEKHDTAGDFLARARGVLEEDEALNNLILGVAQRARDLPQRIKDTPYFATVQERGKLAAAAVMTPPQRVILWTANQAESVGLGRIAAHLHESDWCVPGAVGLKETVRAFSDVWCGRTGAAVATTRDERAYRLDEVRPLRLVQGGFRSAHEADVPLLAEWLEAFEIEALGARETADPIEWATTKVRDGDLFLWEDGEPVSAAARTRLTRHGATIGYVYTRADRRGFGYATACVASLSQALLGSGRRFCTLFANLANPISNHVYQKMGFCPIGDFTILSFTKVA